MITAYERGRRVGIRQAEKFIKKTLDEPTITEDLEKWVMPHGWKASAVLEEIARQEVPNGK